MVQLQTLFDDESLQKDELAFVIVLNHLYNKRLYK